VDAIGTLLAAGIILILRGDPRRDLNLDAAAGEILSRPGVFLEERADPSTGSITPITRIPER
jgi:hypothetical protein